MKEKKSYNLLTTVWLWVVLIGVMPVLGRNLLVSLQFGVGAPADLKFPYTLMILGGVVCFLGYILLLCKRKLGVWLIFLSLPVAYGLAKLYLYFFGLPGVRSGGLMFVFYIILPLLLNLVTAGLLCLRRRGHSGWDLLRKKEEPAVEQPKEEEVQEPESESEDLREEDDQADGGSGDGADEDAGGA